MRSADQNEQQSNFISAPYTVATFQFSGSFCNVVNFHLSLFTAV